MVATAVAAAVAAAAAAAAQSSSSSMLSSSSSLLVLLVGIVLPLFVARCSSFCRPPLAHLQRPMVGCCLLLSAALSVVAHCPAIIDDCVVGRRLPAHLVALMLPAASAFVALRTQSSSSSPPLPGSRVVRPPPPSPSALSLASSASSRRRVVASSHCRVAGPHNLHCRHRTCLRQRGSRCCCRQRRRCSPPLMVGWLLCRLLRRLPPDLSSATFVIV